MCIFLRYPYEKKSWKFFDLKNDFFFCLLGMFMETKFPFSPQSNAPPKTTGHLTHNFGELPCPLPPRRVG